MEMMFIFARTVTKKPTVVTWCKELLDKVRTSINIILGVIIPGILKFMAGGLQMVLLCF